MKLTKEIGN
jgi:hypothetical protein